MPTWQVIVIAVASLCVIALLGVLNSWYYKHRHWLQHDTRPADYIRPLHSVMHLTYPTGGVRPAPPGYVRCPNYFRIGDTFEDAWILPGAPLEIDYLRPGESCGIGLGFPSFPAKGSE